MVKFIGITTSIVAENADKRDHAIRSLVARVIHESSKSRAQIVEEMSALLGQRISIFMLNDFSAGSKKQVRFPLAYVEAFCRVVGDDRLRRLALDDRMNRLLDLGERVLAASRNIRTLIDADDGGVRR